MATDQQTREEYRKTRTAELKEYKKAALIRLAKKYFRLTFDERTKNDDIIKAIVDHECPYPYAENGTLAELEVTSEGKDTGEGTKASTSDPKPSE